MTQRVDRLLGRSEIRVWSMATGAVPALAPSLLETVLAPWELAKAAAFVRAEDCRDYLCAHVMRRMLLTDCFGPPAAGWRFDSRVSGKPDVTTPLGEDRAECSITHTRAFVAAAVTMNRQVGIDAEALDHPTVDQDIADLICSPQERVVLRTLEADPPAWRHALMRIWVDKEAFAKAVGLGLSLPFSIVEFDPGGRLTLAAPVAEAERADDWQLWRFQSAHAVGLSVVARARGMPIAITHQAVDWRYVRDRMASAPNG